MGRLRDADFCQPSAEPHANGFGGEVWPAPPCGKLLCLLQRLRTLFSNVSFFLFRAPQPAVRSCAAGSPAISHITLVSTFLPALRPGQFQARRWLLFPFSDARASLKLRCRGRFPSCT